MSHPYAKIEAALEQERRDLARFERYARWLTFAAVAGGLLGLAALASLGCSEDVPRYYAALDDAPTGDSGDAGDSATDAPTDEEPWESVSDTVEIPTADPTAPEPTAPATDDPPDTGTPPDTGPNPPTDTPADTGPVDTGSDLPSDPGPATDVPDPTSSGPADTGSDIPTTEPEPTGEPEPTVDTAPEPDPACADECCHVANGLRWRAPVRFVERGDYMWRGIDGVYENICEEMAILGDCGITTWRLPKICEWNEEVVMRHPEPDAPCACTIAWDPPDPTTASGTKSGQCFREGWTSAWIRGEPYSYVVRCAGEPFGCPLAYWVEDWKIPSHVMCVADPD